MDGADKEPLLCHIQKGLDTKAHKPVSSETTRKTECCECDNFRNLELITVESSMQIGTYITKYHRLCHSQSQFDFIVYCFIIVVLC